MNKRILSSAAVLATAVIAGAGLTSSASAATDHQLTTANADPNRTVLQGAARADLLPDGIHLAVPDPSTDYAVGVFAVSKPLASVGTVTDKWFGTDNRPGIKLNVDADGDGSVDCQLVHEDAYGDTDVYLNKDAQDFRGNQGEKDSVLVDDYCANRAPSHTSGSGDDAHGTLDAWAAKLGSKATVIQAGYGASGLKQDGVLESFTLGAADRYTFTDGSASTPAPTPTATTGKYTAAQMAHGISFTFETNPLGDNQTQGATIKWTVKVDDKLVYRANQGAGSSDYYRLLTPPTSGASTVTLYKDGTLKNTYTVR